MENAKRLNKSIEATCSYAKKVIEKNKSEVDQMEDKIKKQSIDRLNISVSILEGLKQNNIIKIEDKCSFFTYLLIVFNELSILH